MVNLERYLIFGFCARHEISSILLTSCRCFTYSVFTLGAYFSRGGYGRGFRRMKNILRDLGHVLSGIMGSSELIEAVAFYSYMYMHNLYCKETVFRLLVTTSADDSPLISTAKSAISLYRLFLEFQSYSFLMLFNLSAVAWFNG